MQKKSSYTLEDLLQIMRKLRSEDGCPWDKVQTHDSIAFCAVEEAWEVVDAIHQKNDAMLKNELGDLLLQVIFHAQIGAEEHSFTFDDVVYEICHKLITRHSHIFGEDRADTALAVNDLWDKNKQKEKHFTSYTQTLEDVPKAFPGLLRAQKVSKRAAKAGFDWENISGAMDKVAEELSELQEAVAVGSSVEMEEEFGDLLFAAVNVARFLSADSEQLIQRATDKFIDRFSQMERLAQTKGCALDELTVDEQNNLWNQIKENIHAKEKN